MDFIKSLSQKKVSIVCAYLSVLIYFGIDRSIEYATDSYAALMMDDNWKVKVYENGRVLQGLLYYLIELLHLPSGIKYQLSYLCAFIFLGLSIFVFSTVVNKYIRNEIISVIISFLTIVNPFFVEFFLFIEKGMFCFVIFLNIFAVYLTERLFRKSNEQQGSFIDNRAVASVMVLVCLIISVFMYQTLISLYVVLCLPVIALNTENFIKKNIFVALMYAIPMTIAYILAKFVYPVERLSQRSGLSAAFRAVIDAIKEVSFGKFSYLDEKAFGAWLISLIIIVGLFLICRKKELVRHSLLIIYEVVGCLIISFAVVFFNDSEISPRVVYSYASLFGIVLIYVITKLGTADKAEWLPRVITGCSFALIAVISISEYFVFQRCFIERYRCNQADLYLCNIVGEKIKEYEAETGNTIDTLCYYSDMARSWQDAGYEKTATSTRAQATGWSRTYALNYYLGTDYKEGEPDAELLNYFETINWDTYSDEQLIFDGNTLHICIY